MPKQEGTTCDETTRRPAATIQIPRLQPDHHPWSAGVRERQLCLVRRGGSPAPVPPTGTVSRWPGFRTAVLAFGTAKTRPVPSFASVTIRGSRSLTKSVIVPSLPREGGSRDPEHDGPPGQLGGRSHCDSWVWLVGVPAWGGVRGSEGHAEGSGGSRNRAGS